MATRTHTRNAPYQRPQRTDFSAAQKILATKSGHTGGTNPADPPAPGTRVIVSNLHYEITKSDLIKIFGRFGEFSREPSIRYDRSGRSTGLGFVNYVNPVDADNAKSDLNGVNAKGQPLAIRIDYNPLKPSAPSRGGEGGVLKHRISSAPLLHRLGDKKDTTMKDADSSSTRRTSGPGPVRHPRGSIGKSNSDSRVAPRASSGKPRSQPKTQDDLDKELDDFMKDNEKEGEAVDDEAMEA